jgi:hypothetical protein
VISFQQIKYLFSGAEAAVQPVQLSVWYLRSALRPTSVGLYLMEDVESHVRRSARVGGVWQNRPAREAEEAPDDYRPLCESYLI